MAEIHSVNEFGYATLVGRELTNSDTEKWADIDELTVGFDDLDTGVYLVTLIIPDTWNDQHLCGAGFRLILRAGFISGETNLGEGYYYSAVGQQRVPFALAATAQLIPTRGGTRITAQWSARKGGTAHIGARGRSSLTAIGKVTAG